MLIRLWEAEFTMCSTYVIAETAAKLGNNEQSVRAHCVGQLARCVATCPDANSNVNSLPSEPLINVATHKAVTRGTECPCPELCGQDVFVGGFCTGLTAFLRADRLRYRWALDSSPSHHHHLLPTMTEACFTFRKWPKKKKKKEHILKRGNLEFSKTSSLSLKDIRRISLVYSCQSYFSYNIIYNQWQ